MNDVPDIPKAEDNIKYIVYKIENALKKKVSYSFMWIGHISDDRRIWHIHVENYPNQISIPEVILSKLKFEQIISLAEYLIEKIRIWDLNFGSEKDKVINISAEIIDNLPKKDFYDVVKEFEDII